MTNFAFYLTFYRALARLGVRRLRMGDTRVILTSRGLEEVRDCLQTHSSQLPAFTRIGSVPLPLETQKEIHREILRILRSPKASECFTSPVAPGPIELAGWGVRETWRRLKPLVIPRVPHSESIESFLTEYIENVAIRANIRSTDHLTNRSAQNIWNLMANCMAKAEPHRRTRPEDHATLLDLVNSAGTGLSWEEKAEVLSRLVLSLVGFTGVSLEWALLELACSKTTHPREVLHRSLQTNPSAWKILRAHERCPRMKEERIIIISGTQMMSHRTVGTAFGIWGGRCPAESPALEYLEKTISTIQSTLTVHTSRSMRLIRGRRLTAILDSPPRHKLRLELKEREDAPGIRHSTLSTWRRTP
ncbi:hypothetical protein [Arthrobacter woluwensis]|uniref:Cytochrome P450 n=1 Tax=Arthrobacter woluwensis TaxID=156980 RepID=A0A1H4KTH1_9MICC|nr:hypothetical protein [Arthrobacter woluwensis]SEB61703.1 hypothetical protein SAMN04489745_0788 [Arthrobacter woluwensis]